MCIVMTSEKEREIIKGINTGRDAHCNLRLLFSAQLSKDSVVFTLTLKSLLYASVPTVSALLSVLPSGGLYCSQ